MHDVRAPKHTYFMWQTVKPVVEKINAKQQQHPGIPGQRNGRDSVIFINPDVHTNIQNFQ